MRILITNDDGIDAHGIRVLAEIIGAEAEVYVAAPAANQSGSSHGLTAEIPLYAHPVALPGAVKAWAITGKPADCVKLSLEKLLPAQPDLVVAGINNGPNLGTDIIYSGTCGAAREGLLHGYPSIAVSVASSRRHSDLGNYQLAAEITLKYCRKLACGELPRTMLNINVPGDQPQDVRGIRYCKMGWRWYSFAYDMQKDNAGTDCYWLGGKAVDRNEDGSTDVEVVSEGYASVTPIQFDMTDYSLLRNLRN